eukprot:scaffold445894_cov37-Prasinocladus_malaysianus.AAC.1
MDVMQTCLPLGTLVFLCVSFTSMLALLPGTVTGITPSIRGPPLRNGLAKTPPMVGENELCNTSWHEPLQQEALGQLISSLA